MRFALWVAGLLGAALALFGAFVYFSLAQGLHAAIDDSLRLSGSQAIAAVNMEDSQLNFTESVPEGTTAAALRDRGLTIRILDPAGHVAQSFGPYRALPVDAASLVAAQQGQAAFATVTASLQPVGSPSGCPTGASPCVSRLVPLRFLAP